MELLFNSIQDYLYSIFYDTNRSKAVLQEIKFLQYILILTCDKIWLILYTAWGLASSEGLASSLLRCSVISDHLRVGSKLKLV